MRYRSFDPGPRLAPHVECFWTLADPSPAAREPEPVWPDGCLELIVHLGRPFRALDGEASREQPRAMLVGQLLGPLHLAPQGAVATFGVRFRPGGARAFFGFPLDEIAGAWVPLDALWGADAARFVGALGDAPDDRARARVARATLEHRLDCTRHAILRATSAADGIDAAIARVLATRGALPIGALADEIGWGARRLERRFQADVGVTPKTFARIVRFQSLLARLPERDPDWVALALDVGFFDQSHLIADVRALSGATPTALATAQGLAATFTARDRIAAYFAG